MSKQIFISYRREGGNIYAKAVCDALQNCGYTVFYDFDSIHGDYFDSKIMAAIEECNDFILILSDNALDKCINDADLLRLEIRYALKCNKNIIPVILPEFAFPATIPNDIKEIEKIGRVLFSIPYFNAVIDTIKGRMISSDKASDAKAPGTETELRASEGLEFCMHNNGTGYIVSRGICTDAKTVIPNSYNGKPVLYIADNAFSECPWLTSIVIPDGILAIGEEAFQGCESLESITLPDSVFGFGDDIFSSCSSLSSCVLSKNLIYIPGGAFNGCSSLTSIVIPNGVKGIDSYAFSGCSSLNSIVIPESVTKIEENAFSFCSSLASIVIPNSITSIENDAFKYCRSLTSIVIPDNVKSIGSYVFSNCESLVSIFLPVSIESIGKFAFEECTALTNVNYSGTTEEWSNIGFGAFWNSDSISTVHCTDGDYPLVDKLEFSLNQNGDGYILRQGPRYGLHIVIPRFYNGKPVTEIGESAFQNCSSLISVIIPNTVTTIGDSAFDGCSALTSLALPYTVTSIGDYAFSDCSSLTSIIIPNNTSTIGESAFAYCSSLVSIILPDNITRIGLFAFEDCNNVNTVIYQGTVKQWGNILLDTPCFPEHINFVICADGEAEIPSDDDEDDE